VPVRLLTALSPPPPQVFEEIATLEHQFEGIPTVPPRKDMDHFAFFCDGCRYRRAHCYCLALALPHSPPAA
jgi:hypothetical protein